MVPQGSSRVTKGTMTLIQADIRETSGAPLSGYIRITLDYPIQDETTDYLSVPSKVDLGTTGNPSWAPGYAEFDLEPSDLAKVTYYFEIFQYLPGGDQRVWEFRAKVPYSATPIKLVELSKTTGIARDLLDSNLSAIVRRLYLSEDFWDRAGEALFPPKGEYIGTQWYKRGDTVTWQGNGYRHISPIATIGVDPTDTSVWFQYVSRGATGAGTTGNNAAYSASGWDGQTDAPSRNAVRDIIETLETKAVVATKVSATGAILTGATSADTIALSDSTQKLAYTAWVQGIASDLRKALCPVGIFAEWGTNTAPQYWVLCDGRAISRTTYSALFTLWGTTYGAGDGTSTFNVPDFRGRAIVGCDSTTLQGAAGRVTTLVNLGDVSGSQNSTQTIAQRGTTAPTANTVIAHDVSRLQPSIAVHIIAYAGV